MLKSKISTLIVRIYNRLEFILIYDLEGLKVNRSL